MYQRNVDMKSTLIRRDVPVGSELEAYSEPCQTFTMERFQKQLTTIIISASYNYFRNISFSSPLVDKI